MLNLRLINLFLMLVIASIFTVAQTRVPYNGREIFQSGCNVAWVNYSRDLGPSAVNSSQFENIFSEFHQSGGNIMRFWLHNDGTATPQFDNATGLVTGPGSNTLSNLKRILDAAQKYDVGLQLCIWGFNMQRASIGTTYLDRNKKMLNDSTYTRAYINNSLIPMVNYVKGHPAIFAWEIFNEPEGMSNEFGWSDINRVPMLSIQRFINMVSGAIHRVDPTAKVTSGANRINQCSDISVLAKVSAESILNSMNEQEKRNLESLIKSKYNFDLTAEQIVKRVAKIAETFQNYYRDDRLIQAGNDSKGTLDFYNIHYYYDGVTTNSPYLHPYSFWKLDKPLVVAEFYMNNNTSDGSYKNFFKNLFDNGYAGAMSWQWLGDTKFDDGPSVKTGNHSRTVASLQYLYQNFHNDIVASIKSGTVYKFIANKLSVQKGDTLTLDWETEAGSVVTLNNESVSIKGKKIFVPTGSATYTLTTTGQNPSSKVINVGYVPTGKILYARAFPSELNLGDTTRIVWTTSKDSKVTCNGKDVQSNGEFLFVPTIANPTVKLFAKGETIDSTELKITFVTKSPAQINRALAGIPTASSSDSTDALNKLDNMNDGNQSTAWISGPTDFSQWCRLDFDKPITINSIVLNWGSSFPTNYTITASTDNINWSPIKFITGGKSGIINFSNLVMKARSIKLILNTKSQDLGSAGYALNEFEVYGSSETGIINSSDKLPTEFELNQNYPNPFNPSTVITYQVPIKSRVQLKLYDGLGREIATLLDIEKPGGKYQYIFNSQSLFNGIKLSSGIYFCRLIANNFDKTIKMVLMK